MTEVTQLDPTEVMQLTRILYEDDVQAGVVYEAFHDLKRETQEWYFSNARAVLTAGYRKTPEPEWEYGAGYEGDNGVEVRWFSMGGVGFKLREAAEHEVERYADSQIRLVRRSAPGPWLPVEEKNPDA